MSDVGRFVWYDLVTRDVEAAKAFYTKVVGWGIQEWGEGPSAYPMWTAGDVPIGGVGPLPPEVDQAGLPPHWMAHVTVEDVDASARRAEATGGRIVEGPTDIPEVGRFAVIADPQGAVLSLFRPRNGEMRADMRKPGFVGWHELHATDHEAAWEFHSSLLGWKRVDSVDMGEIGTYLLFGLRDQPEGEMVGAMFDGAKLSGASPHWLYYFNVDDVDAAVERVKSAGGSVLHGPMEVPGGGRVAQCGDDQGGAFALFTPQ
jgi:predicted enzyme related to lactoylglutathione lyase